MKDDDEDWKGGKVWMDANGQRSQKRFVKVWIEVFWQAVMLE